MASKTYVGGNHSYALASAWSSAGTPQSGDDLFIYSGTVTATGMAIQNEHIAMESGAPMLVLQNATLGTTATVFSSGEDTTHPPVIGTKGNVTNAGLITDAHNTLDINLGSASTFTNSGVIDAVQGIGAVTVNIAGGTFHNTGTLNAGGNGQTPGGIINMSGHISNSGEILALGGTININPTGAMTNSGVITDATPGAPLGPYTPSITMNLSGVLTNTDLIYNVGSMSVKNATPSGSVTNSGTVRNLGSMVLDTNVKQTAAGVVLSGASLVDNGNLSGGTVQITSGMLEFGSQTTPSFIGTASAENFSAALNLEPAASAELKFDNTPNGVFAQLQGSQLDVFAIAPNSRGSSYTQIADLHLTGGAYSQAEFKSSGSMIQFTHS